MIIDPMNIAYGAGGALIGALLAWGHARSRGLKDVLSNNIFLRNELQRSRIHFFRNYTL